MNAHQWLDQATRELPEGVAGRVSRETRAHLQDAGWPEGADVREVLGDPETTNDELRRLYLTRKELEEVQTGGSLRSGWNLAEWLSCLFPVVWMLLTWGDRNQWWSLIFYLPTFALIQRLHPVQRRHWRLWLLSLLLAALWLPELMEQVAGRSTGWLLLVFLLLSSGVNFLRRDARLRRTLQAEEGRA